ncbi:MAG: hypothetical protein HGA71_01380 [Azonexaceae bacterium]|nr:hypothetical protein [Azonexaceae bacterium]
MFHNSKIWDALRISHAATTIALVVAWHPAHAALADDLNQENLTKTEASSLSRHNQSQDGELAQTKRKLAGSQRIEVVAGNAPPPPLRLAAR